MPSPILGGPIAPRGQSGCRNRHAAKKFRLPQLDAAVRTQLEDLEQRARQLRQTALNKFD